MFLVLSSDLIPTFSKFMYSSPTRLEHSLGIRISLPLVGTYSYVGLLSLILTITHIYPVSMTRFCLSHSFVYLLYFCLN